MPFCSAQSFGATIDSSVGVRVTLTNDGAAPVSAFESNSDPGTGVRALYRCTKRLSAPVVSASTGLLLSSLKLLVGLLGMVGACEMRRGDMTVVRVVIRSLFALGYPGYL
jgi:hypothetical protein